MAEKKIARETDEWKILRRQTRFADPHLVVATVRARTPAQSGPRDWTIAHRKPAVVIAPMTAKKKFVLIRQERIPIRSAIWEMPAGQIDETGKIDDAVIEAVARRELREETGYELGPNDSLVSLGSFFSSPGFTDERAYFFFAHPVRESADGHARTAGESIVDCREFSIDTLRQMIADGEIRDANTLGIWARMVARGNIFP